MSVESQGSSAGRPESEAYDIFVRAKDLYGAGNPAAASILFERLCRLEPQSASAHEDWARSLFDAAMYEQAVIAFTRLEQLVPDDDYAHYGLGMSLWRVSRFRDAQDQLAMAFAMAPHKSHYANALTQVRATLRARAKAGLPLDGPIDVSEMRSEPQAEGGNEAMPALALQTGSAPLSKAYDVALLDLDGVVYIGEHAVPQAIPSLHKAVSAGMRLGYVTNNASRPPQVVASHLTELGLDVAPHDVVTSSQAGARLVAERLPAGSRVLAVGGPGVADALAERGFTAVFSNSDDPAAVLQGFGKELTWASLAEASFAVARGIPWIATNLDLTIPVPGGIAPGNGTLIGVVSTATGRTPDAVAGKPHPPLMVESVERLAAQRPLVVGDRLDTDIEGAISSSLDSLLVLTGVCTVADLVSAPAHRRPTYVGLDLGAINEPQSTVVVTGESAMCGLTAVTRGTDGWNIVGDDVLEAVRCVAVLAWQIADSGGDLSDLGPVIADLQASVDAALGARR